MLRHTSEARALLQGLRVYKFCRIPVFGCPTNLDHSLLLYHHSCLDMRNVMFISANKPTTHIPQFSMVWYLLFSTVLVIQLDAQALLCYRHVLTSLTSEGSIENTRDLQKIDPCKQPMKFGYFILLWSNLLYTPYALLAFPLCLFYAPTWIMFL